MTPHPSPAARAPTPASPPLPLSSRAPPLPLPSLPLQTRMRKLEGLRLQVDARRRRVHRRYMRALGRMEHRGGGGPFDLGMAGGGGMGGGGGLHSRRSECGAGARLVV